MPDVTLHCQFTGCTAQVVMPTHSESVGFSYDPTPAGWVVSKLGRSTERSWGVCPEHTSVRLTYPDGEALQVKVHWEGGSAVFTATEEKTGYRMVAAAAPSNTGALQNWRGEPSSERGKALIAEAYGLRVGD